MAWFNKLLTRFDSSRSSSRFSDFLANVNAQETELENLSDQEIRQKADQLKTRIRTAVNELGIDPANVSDPEQRRSIKKQIDNILEPEIAYAFALVREAGKRTLGLRHYDVQLIGGLVLHRGQVAEMKTGEGKTLVASLALFLNALTGHGVHLVTVNDYLARLHAGWMGRIFAFLGVSTSVIGPEFSYLYDEGEQLKESDWRLRPFRAITRREAYEADITYGTNNEFGFDYLRDNLVTEQNRLSQRELAYAIVDEIDSILIDEARTPLIIAGPAKADVSLYSQFAQIAPKLKKEDDYLVDEKLRAVTLTDQGIKKIETLLGLANLYEPGQVQLVHQVNEAIKAHALFKKNKDYVVKDGEVLIVDEFTGRILAGRRFSGGLHQALEAKEKVPVREETVTQATITFQNYFRIYWKLSGMTGTAATEAEELAKIYNLEVETIPTHRPSQRIDLEDQIYPSEEGKLKALVEKIKELHNLGQPVLVGTVSIAKSEKLSRLLKANRLPHQVLNAKQHQKEGEVIARAGEPGAITVATNMAGRGVDIVLGGAAPDETSSNQDLAAWQERNRRVVEVGGLFVLGTERHESRRIDNQLRGRAGRQGDPGTTQFYLSTDDDLMRIFGGDRLKNLMTRLKMPEETAINHKLISRAIEQAQARVEGHHFDSRKHLLEYDDVMNKHREAIYRRRRAVLLNSPQLADLLHQEVLNLFSQDGQATYQEKTKNWPKDIIFQVERAIVLRAIDQLWVEHLGEMEQLRESIELRSYGQREPIVEYKQEAYRLFNILQETIDQEITGLLLRVEVNQSPTLTPAATSARPANNLPSGKVGRNDPCPCGAIDPQTGKVYKYKKCGLINASYHLG